ncbi:hypothetical protein TNCV_2837911 [Trichonephila clavipes]|nr:hypothetical protein TNCV_2837911 [Trichonephila clavipes]
MCSLVLSVQEECNPVDDETDEDNNNNENSKGPLNADAFFASDKVSKSKVTKALNCVPNTRMNKNSSESNEDDHSIQTVQVDGAGSLVT